MSTELYWLWALSCDSRSTSLAIVFFREPSWRLLLFLLVTSSTKMAAGSLKCGSVRRKCSRKLARKAGFIRRLHGRSRKVGSSDYIVYTYRCVCVCVRVWVCVDIHYININKCKKNKLILLYLKKVTHIHTHTLTHTHTHTHNHTHTHTHTYTHTQTHFSTIIGN